MTVKSPTSKAYNKAFVLDTSTLLYSPQSLFSFGSKDVFLPISVLDELDRFKVNSDENGKNARYIIRILHDLRNEGSLCAGVYINEKNGRLFTITEENIPPELFTANTDNRILGVCKGLKNKYDEVVLISKDINLIIKADTLGISAQDFVEDSKIKEVDELYTGFTTLTVSEDIIDFVYANKAIQLTDVALFPNQFVLLRGDTNAKHTAMTRVRDDGCSVSLIKKREAWGIEAKNLQQTYALDLLMDDSVQLVTLTGRAGSGKTILTVAAGLTKVLEEKKYKSLVITRPTVPLGKNSDLGFLPGSIYDKFEPWMRPIRDQVEVMFGTSGMGEDQFEDMVNNGIIKVEPLAYIRGRSFHNSYIILDESQNISRHEIKTFLTRAGENTKVVLTGDILQIDNPAVDSISNGLTQVVEKFKDEDIAGHVTLLQVERGKLAELASTKL